MGEVVPARTSPTLHPPSPPTVLKLSWLKVSSASVVVTSTLRIIIPRLRPDHVKQHAPIAAWRAEHFWSWYPRPVGYLCTPRWIVSCPNCHVNKFHYVRILITCVYHPCTDPAQHHLSATKVPTVWKWKSAKIQNWCEFVDVFHSSGYQQVGLCVYH